jgi:hypothetical protein
VSFFRYGCTVVTPGACTNRKMARSDYDQRLKVLKAVQNRLTNDHSVASSGLVLAGKGCPLLGVQRKTYPRSELFPLFDVSDIGPRGSLRRRLGGPRDPTVDLSAKRHKIDRLGEKRLRAAFQGFSPGIVVAVGRDHDDGNVGPSGFSLG